MASAFARMHVRLFRHFGAKESYIIHADNSVTENLTVIVKKGKEDIDLYDQVVHRTTVVEFKLSEYPSKTKSKDILVITDGDYAGTYKIGTEVSNNGFVIGREAVLKP